MNKEYEKYKPKLNPVFKFCSSTKYFEEDININDKEFKITVMGDYIDFPVAHVSNSSDEYLIRLDTLEYITNKRLNSSDEKELIKYLSNPDPHYSIDNRIISAINEWNFGYKNTFDIDFKYDTDYLINISEETVIK